MLAGAALQSATGFGFALVSAPLLFAAAEPEQAVGLLILLGLLVNLITLGTEGRRPQPLRPRPAAILAWAVPGVFVGLLALRSLDSTALQVAVTLGVFATLAVRALARRRRDAAAAARLVGGARHRLRLRRADDLDEHRRPARRALHARARRPPVADARHADDHVHRLLPARHRGAGGERHRGRGPARRALAALVPRRRVGHLAGRPVFARLAEDRYEPVLTAVLIATALAGLRRRCSDARLRGGRVRERCGSG